MEYDKNNLVLDFARRTKKNLEFIESNRLLSEFEVYEVTQLINSLLGLLVFPKEKYYVDIPETPLTELLSTGWPEIKTIQGNLPRDNLKVLMRYLRNGISHFNIEFVSVNGNVISGIRVWNITEKPRKCDWKIELSLYDLREIVYKFIDLLEEKYSK